MIAFAQPQWLWIGALACAATIALFVRAARKRSVAIGRFAAASTETSVSRRRRVTRSALVIAGLAFTCLALARPLVGYRWERQPHRGVDLMFAVDTSRSMLAQDLRPDRLTRAKLAVADLARTFEGSRLGLIAFAGSAFVQAPMTADRNVFLESLDALDTRIIPKGGTDLSSAIRAAEQAMASEPGHRKVLLLVSDGEDLAGDAYDTAREAASNGLTIYTVGVGGTQGELIEAMNDEGKPELVRDENGTPVRSKLDESMLRRIAKVSGGAYQPLGADGRGLEALYATARAQLPETSSMGTARKVYTERYQLPLALALGCLLLELALTDRRRRRRVAQPQPAAFAVALALVGAPQLAHAAPAPSPAVSSYNAGTETYRSGDFDAAQKSFEAALRTDSVPLQVDTYFDLGNARYRLGQASLAKKDREATIATWRRALQAYDAALALAPSDSDAKFNRDFVARKLAALEEEKKKEDEKKDEKKDDKKDDKNNEGDKQQNQPQSGQGQQKNPQQSGQGQPKDPQQSGQGQQQDKPQSGQGQQKDPQQSGQGQQQDKPQSGQGQQKDPQQSGQGQQQDKPQSGQGQPKDRQQSDQGQQQDKPQSDQKPDQPSKQPEAGAGSAANAPKPAPQPHAVDDIPDPARSRTDQPDRPRDASSTSAAQAAAAARARADAARRAAGQLTSEEAVQLLESVEGELQPLPITGRDKAPPDNTYTKDW
jgi:Ca-activated chloride channel family protein